jgi:hypothetical protein
MEPLVTAMAEREPMKANPEAPCPMFYAFDAPYPDGQCHGGHLDDADSDYCSVEYDYKPCPNCNNDEYLDGLRDGADITPPHGFGEVIDGDYFALSFSEAAEIEALA